MSETIEFLGYFSSFWLFVFSNRYRGARIAEWRNGGWLERAFQVYEAAVSILIGVVLPVGLLWGLVQVLK